MTGERSLILTEDGSRSRLDRETGELFHNRAGAITEALKNYVEPSGATQSIRGRGSLAVLDVCFGLGYNTWMLVESLLASGLAAAELSVFAIERDADVLPDAISVLEDSRLARARALINSSSD